MEGRIGVLIGLENRDGVRVTSCRGSSPLPSADASLWGKVPQGLCRPQHREHQYPPDHFDVRARVVSNRQHNRQDDGCPWSRLGGKVLPNLMSCSRCYLRGLGIVQVDERTGPSVSVLMDEYGRGFESLTWGRAIDRVVEVPVCKTG